MIVCAALVLLCVACGNRHATGTDSAPPNRLETDNALHAAGLAAADRDAASPAATPAAAAVRVPSPARVVVRGRTDRAAVTLTFDAGADRGNAVQVLDTLREARLIAAFGITGDWARANPDLIRRIVAEGHTLINHTARHESFTGTSARPALRTREQRWATLDGAEQALLDAGGGRGTPYFRPPYGDFDDSVVSDVSARGYGWVVMWTVDSLGWQGLPSAAITRRCVDAAAPGAIYIFHVGSASQDALALPSIIEGLRRQGYAIVPLPELLGDAS